jgi:hypothetical protein
MEREDAFEPSSDEVRGERAAHAIYGLIIVLAVIVAEEGTEISAGEAIASVVGAATITALAELYADYIGATIRSRRHLTSPERGFELRNITAGFLTALLPAGFFVLAALNAIELETAFDAAVWMGVGLLGVYAVVANRLAGFSMPRSLLVGIGFTLLGAALVAIKAIA